MQYSDGHEAMAGDVVQIDGRYQGVVVACIDRHECLPSHEGWNYLGEGIMVDTDFAGLVHYTPTATDELVLLHRAKSL